MPYKFEKIPFLKGTKYDKRRKLTQEQKDEIISLKGTLSQRQCANLYGVSRRLIQFLWNPEEYQKMIKLRKEKGGEKIYYDKEKRRVYAKKHRDHKKKFIIN